MAPAFFAAPGATVAVVVVTAVVAWLAASPPPTGGPSEHFTGNGACATPDDTACAHLAAWLIHSGVSFNGVVASREGVVGGRGLVATRALAPDEALFTVPAHAWLSEESVATGSAVGRLLNEDPLVRAF